ncbi:MAG TPA: DUF2147 domain-containing protein [Flavobacterium sp.]|jgi:uncharacterized protein (DUF2147 family)
MKKYLMISAFVLSLASPALAQGVIGKWKSVDDETGKTVAIVEIFERNAKVYGKIVEITNPADKNKKCVNCTGEDKDKPILGLTVIKGLTKDGDEYNGGHILDPKYGKLYKCYITNEGPDRLKVRGYIGFSLLGRTQYWQRVK